MDSTSRPTGCPCGEGILNKPKNGTTCHLPANRKFLFHAHFSLQKDFFSNFLSPLIYVFCDRVLLLSFGLEFDFKRAAERKNISVQEDHFSPERCSKLQNHLGARCILFLPADKSPAIRIGRPLLIFADHIFNSNLPLGSTPSHDYQAGERDYSWCFCETMASFSHFLQLRLLRRKQWHIFPIFALLYKLPPNYYRSASVKQGANICFGLPPIAISPKLSKISPPTYLERNTAPSPRYGHRWSHRKDWK